MFFSALREWYSTFEVFMLGAVLYLIAATVSGLEGASGKLAPRTLNILTIAPANPHHFTDAIRPDGLITKIRLEIILSRVLCNPAHAPQEHLHAHVDSGKLRCVGSDGQ